MIIDRIKWEWKLKKEEFIIAYEDRFLGIMEVPFEDFVKSDAKDHRIRYFKKNGEVIWDRIKKIDNF